ncbi:MAG TPA: TfoX/Sxy family protein [Planctomycetota bacterium]|nr:TfoX/Sxy family protein [Planctomycetota bacterium]
MRDEHARSIVDSLAALRGVEARAMFGGHGLYRDDEFFGIVWRGHLYFRTDETTRGDYLAAGSKPFRPRARMKSKRYFEVPLAVLENPPVLVAWALKAVAARRSG